MSIENPKRDEPSGEYVWKNPNPDPRFPGSEYVELNTEYENLYSNYTEKCKKWTAYSQMTKQIESGKKEQVDEAINRLEKYIDAPKFNERKGEISLGSRIAQIREVQEIEKNNSFYGEQFILLVRKTLDAYSDLFVGLVPKEELIQPGDNENKN